MLHTEQIGETISTEFIYPRPSKISDILELIFSSVKHEFSDIYMRSNGCVMLRAGQLDWRPFLYEGKPLEVKTSSIIGFMNALYSDDPNCEKEEFPPVHAKKRFVEAAKKTLNEKGSLHPALSLGSDSNSFRIRCTIQKQGMGEEFGLMMRIVPSIPESITSIGLPIQISQMIGKNSGLIVVTGPTGSGKSTSIAAMLEEINKKKYANILTLEDPIEFKYFNKKSIVTQREIGPDVASFTKGVLDAMRFVPDVLMVGECRDSETMKAVLRAGESGHLVITSMHAPTAIGALKKMVALLDGNTADVQALYGCLIGIVAQNLLPKKDGKKVLAFELMNFEGEQFKKALFNDSSSWSDIEAGFFADKASIPFSKSAERLIQEKLITPDKAATLPLKDSDRQRFLKIATTLT